MDSERALSALGLVTPTSEHAIRRAYLQGVRKHPPERDPEGFRRVRDAYELLKDAPWLWGGGAAPQDPEPTPEVREREAVAASTEDAQERVAASTDAAEAGPESRPDFDELFGFEPTSSDPRWVELQAALAAHDSKRAAPSMVALYRAGPAENAPLPSAWSTLQTTIELIEQAEYATARELLAAFEDRTARDQAGASAFGTAIAARWVLVRELAELSHSLDRGLLRSLAKAVRTGKFGNVAKAVQRAGGSRDVVRSRAPTLFAAIAPLVAWSEPAQRRRSWVPWWVSLVALTSAIRMGVRGCEADKPTRDATHGSANRVASDVGAVAYAAPTRPEALASLERQVTNATQALDAALAANRCDWVREQWPLYTFALRTMGDEGELQDGYARERAEYDRRRAEALERCDELTGELAEAP